MSTLFSAAALSSKPLRKEGRKEGRRKEGRRPDHSRFLTDRRRRLDVAPVAAPLAAAASRQLVRLPVRGKGSSDKKWEKDVAEEGRKE
jgi:hypothetical protein